MSWFRRKAKTPAPVELQGWGGTLLEVLNRPHWGQIDPAVARATADYVLTGQSPTGEPPEPEGAHHWSAYKANDTRWDEDKVALMWRLYEPFTEVDPVLWQRYAALLPARMNVVDQLADVPKAACALLQQLGFLLTRVPQGRERFPLADLGRALDLDPRLLARDITVDRQVKPADSPMLDLIARAPDFPAQLEAAGAFAGLAVGTPITDFVLESALTTDAQALVRAAVTWACAGPQPVQELLRPLFERLGKQACRQQLEVVATAGGVPGRRALEILYALADGPTEVQAVQALATRVDSVPAAGLLRRWGRSDDLFASLPREARELFTELEVDEDPAVQEESLQVVTRALADGDTAAGLRAGHPQVRRAVAWWLAATRGADATADFDAALAVETDGPTRQELVRSQLAHGRPSASTLRSVYTGAPAAGPDLTDLPAVHWADTGEAVPGDVLRHGTQDPLAARALGAAVPAAERDAFGGELMKRYLAVAVDPRAPDPVDLRCLLEGFTGEQAVLVLHDFLRTVHSTHEVSLGPWWQLTDKDWEPITAVLATVGRAPSGVQFLGSLRDRSLVPGVRDGAQDVLDALAEESNCTVSQVLSRTLTPEAEGRFGVGARALQEALLVGTRWDQASWTSELLEHQVHGPAVRDLVWLAGPRKAALDVPEVSFRPSPDGSLTGIDGDPVTLAKTWVVWLAHAALLPTDQADRWRDQLAGTGVAPVQFPTDVPRLTAEQRAAKSLDLGEGELDSDLVQQVCDERGWQQDREEDKDHSEDLLGYVRRFPSAGLMLSFDLDTEGVTASWTRQEALTLDKLKLQGAARFERLSPVLQSAIAGDVAALRALPRLPVDR